jgi:hypothetical protein
MSRPKKPYPCEASFPCEKCGSAAGTPCVTVSGKLAELPHSVRWLAHQELRKTV